MAKTRNVDEMVCSFMAVVHKAFHFANRSLKIYKNKRVRLPKYVMKLIYKKRRCWKLLHTSNGNDPLKEDKLLKHTTAC